MRFFIASIMLFSLQAQAQVSPGVNNHSFQYLTGVLTASSPTTVPSAPAWNAMAPPKQYSMSAATTATGWQVELEGSLDNSNWSRIAITTSATGMVSNVNPIPALYFRMRASTISANTSVTATAIGVW